VILSSLVKFIGEETQRSVNKKTEEKEEKEKAGMCRQERGRSESEKSVRRTREEFAEEGIEREELEL
jgi:Na+-transporting methylmalonyl-CoA/oxaloacetate decarboxylase gamma subunit